MNPFGENTYTPHISPASLDRASAKSESVLTSIIYKVWRMNSRRPEKRLQEM